MHLNFFCINLEFEKYQINTELYSDERIRELRLKYNKTHSFFRNGEEIYISNNQEIDEVTLGVPKTVETYKTAEITSSLIKHVFFRDFKNRFPQYTPIDFYPFRFFSEKDDLLLSFLPNNLKKRIAYKKVIEIQLRKIEYNSKPLFGFVININRNWIFSINCEELNNERFPLTQIEVIHAEILPGLENVLAPNEEFIGVIKEINDNIATVVTNEGEKAYPLSELFIRKTRLNIGNYLNFKIGAEQSTKIFDEIKKRTPEIYNAENLYRDIINIARPLFNDKINNQETSHLFQNKDGFCFTISAMPLQIDNSIELTAPSFIFHYDGTKRSNYADRGLTDFGPYDSTTFDIKNPNILAICLKANRGSFSSFLANLKDGLPNSNYFKKGLLGKYELHSASMNNIQEVQEYTKKAYLDTITQHLRNSNEKPNIAIVEIPSQFRQLKDKDNPYYEVKAKLLSLEIPVQFVTAEKIKAPNEYILNSIALQIYAKLGGTPWVLPTKPSVDREIVVGIGHSWIKDNQYKGAEQNRIVGITTFLSGDGQYLLGEKIKDVKYDDYFEELLNGLDESINVISTEYAWQEGDTVRLLFHIFKPIKNIEFDVISQLIKQKSKFKIQFAFITISKTHPFLLFDTTQNGINDRYGNTKGKYIPNRAQNIILDKETCVVQMMGANELKTGKHGMSSPIQIKIRRPNNIEQNTELGDMLYYDLSYIVHQIYAFTYLSWRGFLPSDEPATMLYSNLISGLLGKMRNVSNWNVDNLNYGLKRKKWFL